ncbi:MAG: type II toxin-antitoxin system death-on-curing family toxin [Candidatus Rokubacteria bacterium]|nr:type II toxin-antitoxin system death-on-curing family toxin [Candidatus Rokubacteria bacterium]
MKVGFLEVDEVLSLHADQIERYGGGAGIRDIGLLRSALSAPSATFEAAFLHGSISEMAAAYLFHIVKNHPFVDGNKRTALMAMLAFLGLNGRRLSADQDELAELVVGVAEGRISRAEVAVFVEHHARRR